MKTETVDIEKVCREGCDIEDCRAIFRYFDNSGDIDSYKINDDGTVDCSGNVFISNMNLKSIPIQFGIVTGNFDCSHNHLTTLDGAPKRLLRATKYKRCIFSCEYNRLTSLIGLNIEEKENGRIWVHCNDLQSLDGYPEGIKECYLYENPNLWKYIVKTNYNVGVIAKILKGGYKIKNMPPQVIKGIKHVAGKYGLAL